jgi:Phospholipase_D-nuclease N-terminal
MVRLFILLAAVQLVLFVLALISCLSADRVRNAPRLIWVLIILLVPLLGPLSYFLWGRPLPVRQEGSPVRRRDPRPSSPDDDPDFLRKVDTEQARRDREMLAQWEKDINKNDEDKSS